MNLGPKAQVPIDFGRVEGVSFDVLCMRCELARAHIELSPGKLQCGTCGAITARPSTREQALADPWWGRECPACHAAPGDPCKRMPDYSQIHGMRT